MRGQGGGTLFSSSVERTKLSMKVAPVTESSEARRRLSGNGGYGSYVGTKSMQVGGTTSASSSGGFRLKGVSPASSIGHDVHRHQQHNEQLDLYGAVDTVVKEYRGDAEPLSMLKRKAATPSPPLPEELSSGGGALLQWGLCKRSRRSRFEASKASASSLARGHGESASKAVAQRAERQSNGDDMVARLRGQGGWASRPAATLDGNSKSAAARSGSRFSDNALGNHHSHVSSPARPNGEKERERVYKVEHRHRSNGAEQPANDNHGFTAAHNRGSSFTELGAAGISAKPRLDLQTLEWPRILISLSRKEKEEDFQKIKGPGSKLPQRPKKRPKAVERALHYCTPGNSLCDLVRGRYDVREKKSVKKKPRGLKAMDSMESDSE